MNLMVTGHHLEVTPTLRKYVQKKLGRITRHFDRVIDAHVILTANRAKKKAEVLADKVDRQVLRYKDKRYNPRP